jgi:hypothetical protein
MNLRTVTAAIGRGNVHPHAKTNSDIIRHFMDVPISMTSTSEDA